jgi:hypothetical protein
LAQDSALAGQPTSSWEGVHDPNPIVVEAPKTESQSFGLPVFLGL